MEAIYTFLIIIGALLGGLFIIIFLARKAEKQFDQKRKKGNARQKQLMRTGVIR